jgi:crotonobetainyl-CoA:carnitine CoA-transferase CaiB-like acyl-CoA transferase
LDWLTELETAHIPAVPIRTVPDLFTDPHVMAVGLLQPVDHPTQGRLRQARLPFQFSGSRLVPAAPAPCLDEHRDQILNELGYEQDEAAALASPATDIP